MSRSLGIGLALTFWLAGILVGLERMHHHASTPGRGDFAPPVWPPRSAVPFANGRINLVVPLHPRCICSLATLKQLQSLTTRWPDTFEVHFLFYRPEGASKDWHLGDAWNRAQEFPGSRCYSDTNGDEARRFGAVTSGVVLAYDERRRIFQGGVTAGRGIAQPGAGLTALEAAARRDDRNAERNPAPEAPVFGCPLLNPSELALTGDRSW